MSGMTTGNASTYEPLSSVYWGDHLVLLDQRLLPEEIVYLQLFTPEEVWEGIHSMKVRGAPAIGIAARFGAVLGGMQVEANDNEGWPQQVAKPALISQRPDRQPSICSGRWTASSLRLRSWRLRISIRPD